MTTASSAPVFRLVYRSRSVLAGSDPRMEEALEDILDRSERTNARLAVTGGLVCVGDTFVQVLEGPRASVEEVFARIRRDRRHTEIQVVDVGDIPAREFEDWAMKWVTTSTGCEALFARFGDVAADQGQAPAAAEEAVSLMVTLVRLELAVAAAAVPAPVCALTSIA